MLLAMDEKTKIRQTRFYRVISRFKEEKLMQEKRLQVHDPQREPVRSPPEIPAVPHPQPDIEPGRAPQPEIPSMPPEPDIPTGPEGPEIIPDPSPPEYPDTETPGEPGEE